MNVLVVGGTGFISSRLVDFLLERGHDVSTVTRGLSSGNDSQQVRRFHADRHDEAALSEIIRNHEFDVVYDMIAYEPDDSRLMVKLLKGRVERFIHCSTISVYMVSNDVRCPITEDQSKRPLMPHWPHNPFGMDYGIKKRQCEEVLWEADERGDFEVSMLRPPYVCGPHDPIRRDYFWVQRILDGGPLLVPGCGHHAFQVVFVDDVARAFVDLLDHSVSAGRAYNVAGREIFSLEEYLRAVADMLNCDPEIVHLDQDVFDSLALSTLEGADVFPFNTRRTAVFSLHRIREDLKYTPTPFNVWMQKTIDWFTNEFDGDSFGYDRREEELQIIRTHR